MAVETLWGATFFIVNETNSQGKTALDILKGGQQTSNLEEGQQTQGEGIIKMRRKIKRMLKRDGAKKASSLPAVTSYARYQNPPGSCERKKLIFIGNKVRKRISDEKRSALLVLTALLVTVTYQAILSPPGGLWQETLFEGNATDVSRDDLFKMNMTAPHRAGSAIALGTYAFKVFMAFNSIIFLSSIATIGVLVPPDEVVGASLVGLSVYLCFGYLSSLIIITQAPDWLARIVLMSPLIIIIVGAALIAIRKDSKP